MNFLPDKNGYVSQAAILSVTGLSYPRQAMFAERAKVKRTVIPGTSRTYGYARHDAVALLEAAGYQEITHKGRRVLVKQMVYIT